MRSSIKWKITYSSSNGTINHWIGDPFEWDDDLFSDPYYKNIKDNLCYICPQLCSSCTYSTLCLTCVPKAYLFSGTCYQVCPTVPVLTYANDLTGLCG